MIRAREDGVLSETNIILLLSVAINSTTNTLLSVATPHPVKELSKDDSEKSERLLEPKTALKSLVLSTKAAMEEEREEEERKV